MTELPSALVSRSAIGGQLEGKRVALFLDYDGTLTPIVSRPEEARLSGAMRTLLRELAGYCTVGIMTGRDRADIESRVGLDELIYAGSHGYDIAGPSGLRLEHEGGRRCLPELDDSERELLAQVGLVSGAQVERKRFAIAVHYRNVADSEVARVEEIVDTVLSRHTLLRKSGGKKVFELLPDIDWDKGRAVQWLLEALSLDEGHIVPIYVGDDLTDEDAFRVLAGRGIGVRVGLPAHPTRATYFLPDSGDVQRFLEELIVLLKPGRGFRRRAPS